MLCTSSSFKFWFVRRCSACQACWQHVENIELSLDESAVAALPKMRQLNHTQTLIQSNLAFVEIVILRKGPVYVTWNVVLSLSLLAWNLYSWAIIKQVCIEGKFMCGDVDLRGSTFIISNIVGPHHYIKVCILDISESISIHFIFYIWFSNGIFSAIQTMFESVLNSVRLLYWSNGAVRVTFSNFMSKKII